MSLAAIALLGCPFAYECAAYTDQDRHFDPQHFQKRPLLAQKNTTAGARGRAAAHPCKPILSETNGSWGWAAAIPTHRTPCAVTNKMKNDVYDDCTVPVGTSVLWYY